MEETIGEAKTGFPSGELIEKQQKELDELTEKLENAERAQKQLFLIVFQVRLNTLLVLAIIIIIIIMKQGKLLKSFGLTSLLSTLKLQAEAKPKMFSVAFSVLLYV